MAKKNRIPYQLFNNYCLRIPLNSYSEFSKINNSSLINIETIITNYVFREAIFLASPELNNQINKWEKRKLKDEKKIEKLKFSIYKYFNRMSTRCTPFGLFASCGIGSFGNETNIRIVNNKRFTSIDTSTLIRLSQELLENEHIRNNILFYPNTSIYKIRNQYRYVEYTIKNKKRNYSLEGVKNSEYLEKILNEANRGSTITKLVSFLIDYDVTQEEAVIYINQLIDSQILVSELEINLTGKNYFNSLLEITEKISKIKPIYNQLKKIQKKIFILDTKIGNSIDLYKSIILDIKKITPNVDYNPIFQTNAYTFFKKNKIDEYNKKELRKVVEIFNKMTLPNANGDIEEFKIAFLKRFEESSEVPLNLVLDPETGIGYGDEKDINNVLEGLSLPNINKRYERFIWSDIDTLLQKKLVQATKNKDYIIKLLENDFKEFPTNWSDLPDTFSSCIEIYQTENKLKIFIENIGGATATYLHGRFSNENKEIQSHVTEISEVEKRINSNKILAEIVHLPENNMGNMVQRSSFRDYEIPYLGKSSVRFEYQIPINDILVTVEGNEIILRSRKLNKEILPRLGNAHNYNLKSLPIYRFLSDFQTQNKRNVIGFSWNPILTKYSFLPRVEFENIIFSKARWRVNTNYFKDLLNKENNLFYVKIWQKKNMIPDLVSLVEGDNKLLINLKNNFSIEMLLNTIKNNKEFVLEEFLFSDNEFIKNKEEASFCNEFIISFYNEAKLNASINE